MSKEVYSNISYDPETNSYSVSRINGEHKTKGPLNVGFQLTRRCNLKCIYCSELPGATDLPLPQVEQGLSNLREAGVLKVNLTGGEALLRPDLKDIIAMSKDFGFFVAIDSNSTLVTDELADFLAGQNLAYFESTIDGTMETHNKVRGSYEKVLQGARKISERGIPLYVAMVLLGKSTEDIEHVLRLGHELGAKQVKFIMPIPKGRGKNLPIEYLDNKDLGEIWERICQQKETEGLSPQVSLADWTKIGKGSVILIYPNGDMIGSPSIGEHECITPMGNILEESVAAIWAKYPYTEEHIKKYAGDTMLTTNPKK